ncbi:MAG: PAS domain-containing protein, partial [Thermomicrobiaceae bacterium]|nr:PAS domain-containing protein [Thermomicrobiaceae bacterium]
MGTTREQLIEEVRALRAQVEAIERAERERHRAEEERDRIARYLQLLLESTSEGVYAVDTEGRCTIINRAGAEALGYAPDELLGRNMHDLVHDRYPDGRPYPERECPIYRAFRDGQPCRVDDDVFWRRDGTPLPVEYSAAPIVDQGRIAGAVVAFNDITARRAAEE